MGYYVDNKLGVMYIIEVFEKGKWGLHTTAATFHDAKDKQKNRLREKKSRISKFQSRALKGVTDDARVVDFYITEEDQEEIKNMRDELHVLRVKIPLYEKSNDILTSMLKRVKNERER